MRSKPHHYMTGFDIISVGTRSSKNPLVQKLIEKTDPLLVLLGLQCSAMILQLLFFLLPLTVEQQQWVTVGGLINVLFTTVNTMIFLRNNKKYLP